MRQRHEAGRVQALVPDLVRGHLPQRVPRRAGGQPHADAVLDRLAAAHGDPGGGSIGQVVARTQQVHLALHHLGLARAHPGEHRREVFLGDRQIAGAGALSPHPQRARQNPDDTQSDRSQP